MPHQISLIGKEASPEKTAESPIIEKTSSLLLATVLEFMPLSLPHLSGLSKSLRSVACCLRYNARYVVASGCNARHPPARPDLQDGGTGERGFLPLHSVFLHERNLVYPGDVLRALGLMRFLADRVFRERDFEGKPLLINVLI